MALLPSTPSTPSTTRIPTRHIGTGHTTRALASASAPHARYAAGAEQLRRTARVLLRDWVQYRERALARGDCAAVARCEDRISWHEIFMGSLNSGSAVAWPSAVPKHLAWQNLTMLRAGVGRGLRAKPKRR